MFIGDWRDSMPRHAFGSLVLRDILTRGYNDAPPQPGAILMAANFVAYGRLAGDNQHRSFSSWNTNKLSFILSPGRAKSWLKGKRLGCGKTSLSSFPRISNSL